MFLFQLCRKYQQHFHQTFLKILTIEIIRYIGTLGYQIGTLRYLISKLSNGYLGMFHMSTTIWETNWY